MKTASGVGLDVKPPPPPQQVCIILGTPRYVPVDKGDPHSLLNSLPCSRPRHTSWTTRLITCV